MLIYDVLKLDHFMVLSIIDTIEMVGDPDRRKDIFSLMRTELVMHSKSEEEVLYEPLRKRTGNGWLVESSEDEHHEIEEYLMKLQTGSADEEDWLENLRGLRAVLQRHIHKEETDVFHEAMKFFNTQEATDMTALFLEGKGKLGMENPLTVAAKKIKELIT